MLGAMAHACNPSYSGDGDLKDCGLGQPRQKVSKTPI
jgi:hypothetical protein